MDLLERTLWEAIWRKKMDIGEMIDFHESPPPTSGMVHPT